MSQPDRVPAAELPPGTVRGAGSWAVGNRDGRLFAVSRRCRHQLADLAEGSPSGGAAHANRVADLCLAIARRMGVEDTTMDAFVAAGRLHQLSSLGGEQNGAHGAALAAHLLSGEAAATIVRHQHEHWDGSGAGALRGVQIPAGARVLAVADAYDHLTAHNTNPQEPAVAMAILQSDRGRRFDPSALDALAAIVLPETVAPRVPVLGSAEAAV